MAQLWKKWQEGFKSAIWGYNRLYLPPPAGRCEMNAGPSRFRNAASIAPSSSDVNVPRPKFEVLVSFDEVDKWLSMIQSNSLCAKQMV